MKKTLEECRQHIQKYDTDTLERRAKRLEELEVIHTSARLFSSQKEWNYAGEASDSYINGNYRSVVFNCACAVDLIFKYEYMKIAGNVYKDIKKCTFGQIIYKCEASNLVSLSTHIDKAKLLNNMRNEVSAHPLFIDLPVKSDFEKLEKNNLLKEDIERLLKLVENITPELRVEVEAIKLESDIEGKSFIFGDIVKQRSEAPFHLDGFWGLIEKDILQFLAKQAWCILKSISEDLYAAFE